MATSVKIAVFWDVAPFSLVDTDLRFRESSYQTTRLYIPEASYLQ
jgi:hypothetical protein